MINDNLFDICVKFNHIFKNESHKKMFIKRIIEGIPLSEIGNEMNTTKQNVSKIILNYVKLISLECSLTQKKSLQRKIDELSKGK